MLGKIYEKGETVLIFNVITKTSNSGLFSNRRMALLSPKNYQIGYLSKVPDEGESFQDASCWSKCKQIVSMRAVNNFLFYLKPEDKSVLILRWQQEKQKQWEFKFDSESISVQWHQQISSLLYPPQVQNNKVQIMQQKQAEVKVDYSKLQTPSRFNAQNDNHNELMIVDQQNNQSESQISNNHSQKEMNNSKPFKAVSRFQDYQKDNATNSQPLQHTTLPIITTFKQKFANQSMFNNLNRQHHDEQKHDYTNWNIRWYQAIQNGQQDDSIIQIYHQFTNTCKNNCLLIIRELTVLKNDRTLIPTSITMNEEIYIIGGVIYRLVTQRDVDYSSYERDNSEQIIRQQLQNFKFVMKATRNRNDIKVPMVCIVEQVGFVFFCEADVPKNYQQVDQTSKYIFSTQIASLQQQLKLKVNLSNISLYTNKPTISPKNIITTLSFIIMRELKQLLPASKRNEVDIAYCLPKQIFLESTQILQITKNSNFYENKKEVFIDSFLKNQFGDQSSIISHDDLIQKLSTHKIPVIFLDQVIAKSNSIYLDKIMMTEIVAAIVCRIIRKQINKLLNTWKSQVSNLRSDSTLNYQALICKIVNELFSLDHQLKVWETIRQQVFRKHSPLVIRKEDLIIGYLLSSISRQMGIEFNYQFFIKLKHRFFLQNHIITEQAILECHPIVNGYTDEEMGLSYSQIFTQIANKTTDQEQYNAVITFFGLTSAKPAMQPQLWLTICRYLSYHVPYGQQEQYSHLDIYSSLKLNYLNNSIFSILVSAVKWLLLTDKISEVFDLISLFKETSWFWVSLTNPFMVSLYQIMSEYYQTKKQIQKAIDYSNECLQLFSNLYKTSPELECLDINYKLAQLYMLHHKHKQALDKYHSVKHVIKKYNRQSSIMLDLLRQISKLYLHLGDADTSIRYCKQTIDYSLLNPFKDEQYEFQIYAILVRALQIKEEQPKFKYYVDIIQDKFGTTNNEDIMKEVLKLTFQQYLQSSTTYHLKKIAFVLYYIEKYIKNESQIDGSAIFTKLQEIQTKSNPCRIIRNQLDKCMELADELTIQKQKKKKESSQQELKYYMNNLIIFCQFVGYQFILGHICSNLQKIQTV